MSRLIEYSRYLSLVAVVVLLLTFIATLGWGAVRAVRFLEHLFVDKTSALDLLMLAVATAIVTAVLVAFAYFVVKSPPAADSPPASRGSSDEHRS